MTAHYVLPVSYFLFFERRYRGSPNGTRPSFAAYSEASFENFDLQNGWDYVAHFLSILCNYREGMHQIATAARCYAPDFV